MKITTRATAPMLFSAEHTAGGEQASRHGWNHRINVLDSTVRFNDDAGRSRQRQLAHDARPGR